ncbi:regulatory protein, luxR family [Lentzea jiangxiensis]|uniref:Regulatory protein, luxR family n=1 Tax=Lentzea jiangxiensis TaxID=641025 RepID=A0A1H0WTB5_9PSEU|nr:regulatory protein, luxR family [Lentzea jiangxiensis]
MHEALRLLILRARAVGIDISKSDHPVANQLCQLLDGLPLAIELAASQLDVLSLQSIVEHPDLLDLLVDGVSTETHHRGLRAMLELSQKLLTEDEQRMWALMAVFESETGFDLNAARAVCAGDGIAAADVQPLLSQLVRKSLLMVDHQAGRTRYRMLRVIRQWGHRLLLEAQHDSTARSADEVVGAAAEHFSGLAQQGAGGWFTIGEVEWMHRLRLELPNLHAAQKHFLSLPEQRHRGRELAINVVRTRCQIFDGKLNDARRMLMLGLQHAGPDPEAADVTGTSLLAWVALLQGRNDLAAPLLAKAERDAATLGLSDTLAPLLYASASAIFLCEPDPQRAKTALPALERAEAAFQSAGCAGDAFMATLFSAMAAAFLGERQHALSQRDRLVAVAAEAQGQWSFSWATWTSALVEFMHGSAKRSITLAQDALRLQRQIGDTWGPTWSAWLLAVTTAKVGDHELAGRLFGAINSLQREAQTCVMNMQPFLRVDQEIRQRCRLTIGDDRFNRAISAGEALSVEDGIALALTPLEAMHRARTGESLLTAKEIEVIGHLARGKRYAEIGRDLDIADRTVETHVRNAKRKLDLRSRAELVQWYTNPTPSTSN